MYTDHMIQFTWEGQTYTGKIEREYENSFLVEVSEPSEEMREKFNTRMIISKKACLQED